MCAGTPAFADTVAPSGLDLARSTRQHIGVTTSYDPACPRRWQWMQRRPDPNIDHRRVPNLMTFFQRRGYALPLSNDPAKFTAGDIVAWDLGRGTVDEDILFRFRIIGHYRLPGR